MAGRLFSLHRFAAVIGKEFVQMRRDRLTFAMMIGIPILQMVLFGFAINSDPKNLPTAVQLADHGPYARTVVAALQNSAYFRVVQTVDSEAEADRLLALGKVQFVFSIPEDFSRSLLRGERPALLLTADATDPAATSNAVGAFRQLAEAALERDLQGGAGYLLREAPPIEVIVHPRYNPEGITRYNIVPGLIGVVLTMTLVIITGLAITRERERGTMENLLSTPVKPAEVMLGKIVPYILVGYVQLTVILLAARFLFRVPMTGSVPLLLVVALVFIAANLGVGLTFSTLARNQLQAMQMSFFFFLPSILLSGFMFPRASMPTGIYEFTFVLPATYFIEILRGIVLRGASAHELVLFLGPLLAIGAILSVIVALTLRRARP
jgi:ABC-2 type transport system permease protein